jgi:hypothetical protein
MARSPRYRAENWLSRRLRAWQSFNKLGSFGKIHICGPPRRADTDKGNSCLPHLPFNVKIIALSCTLLNWLRRDALSAFFGFFQVFSSNRAVTGMCVFNDLAGAVRRAIAHAAGNTAKYDLFPAMP